MATEFISIFENKPKAKGWHGTLHSWDSQEGFFPGASFWDGEKFATTLPVCHFIDKVFDCENDAELFANDNDPVW